MKKNILGLVLAGLFILPLLAYAQVKISELTADGTPTTDDLLITVNDPSGTPATRKATISNVLREPNIPSTITRDTEWDTIGEIETATGVNIILNTEIDTFSELNALVADQTLVHSGSNIATATALASNGANCSAGQYPLGVDASGAAEGCTADDVLTEEEVEDFFGGMVTTTNTETLITVTYQDATGDIDFVVDNDLANYSWTNVDATDLKVGSITQAYDADLDDLADGTLSGSKVGSGIAGDNITDGTIDASEIEDGTILEADLKVVDTPSDEECLTYEATGGDFEWQACGGAAGAIDNIYTTGADAKTSTTSSASGLELVDTDDVTLLLGCSDGQVLKWTESSDTWGCAADSSGGGGTPNILDLADDGSNESADLVEIAVTGDTNSIFTEPTADKLLIAVGNNWPTADTANAGDSATAFFSSGTIEHERGGLEADVSAYSGLVAISIGGVTAEIDQKSELEGQIVDVSDFAEADGDTYSGAHDFGGATLEIPNSTSLPGTCTVGQIYMDTDATTGQRIYACESTNTWALQGDGGGGGSGDVESVGDCTTGACLDGTSDGGTYVEIYNASGNTRLAAGSTSYFQGGNVGIGTTGPEEVLHVRVGAQDSGIRIESTGNGNDAGIEFAVQDNAAQRVKGVIRVTGDTSTDANRLSFLTGTATGIGGSTANERISILSSNGYVGINSTNPNYQLDVNGNVEADAFTEGGIGVANLNEIDTSSEIAAIVSDETGSGALTFATSPVFSTSVAIPNGTAPTVDAAGEIAVDTTDDQLVYYGAAKRVVPYTDVKCVGLEDLASTDDNFSFYMANDAITVTGVGCNCRGTCSTPATFTLEDRGGNAMTITGTNPTCATTGAATFAAVTAGNSLTAGEMIAFDVTNTPTTGDTYALCIEYTTDAQ